MSAPSHLSFDLGVSIADRVAVLSPVINVMIEGHESGDYAVGVEAFQDDLIGRIRTAGLLETKWLQVDHVGVHPDNREKSMLVPVDVHDLLKRMAADGWSYQKWDAMGCEIPASSMGHSWRKQNEELAKGSDGLLAPYQGDMLTILTGRGSHGTAAVRAMKLGAKGIHEDCCADGHVSKSKICERQPSMLQPLSKGCPYDVIKAELVEACPRLMETLSRAGNASNSVYRVQTALQHCNRIHNLVVARQNSGKEVDWDVIAKQACIGMGTEFIEDAKKLSEFVRVWSGGQDGYILKDLEAYEKTLKVKRKLYSQDLQALSKIEFIEGSRYIPAMVKAMLNAPTTDSTGHAVLFTNSDYSSLQPNAKARPFAREANEIMEAGRQFLLAYGRLSPTSQAKLLSDLEVRCVMHVHQKKCETRTSYHSLEQIAQAMYDEAKVLDPKLPTWTKLKTVVTEKLGSRSTGLREIRRDGRVPDSEMISRGFVEGAKVVKKDGSGEIHTVTSLTEASGTITLEAAGDQKSFDVDRYDAISLWSVHVAVVEVKYKPGDYTDPTVNNDLLTDIWKGCVKAALTEAFKKSSENKVVVYKQPSTKVVALKAFKPGALQLVGLTNNITVSATGKTASGTLCLGEAFVHSVHGQTKVYARPHLQFPATSTATGFARNVVEPFIVAYWACQETFDSARANCEATLPTVSKKIGGVSHEICIPTLTNTKPLQEGDEIFVLKVSQAQELPIPDPKRHKSSPSAKASGAARKGTGKGSKAARQ